MVKFLEGRNERNIVQRKSIELDVKKSINRLKSKNVKDFLDTPNSLKIAALLRKEQEYRASLITLQEENEHLEDDDYSPNQIHQTNRTAPDNIYSEDLKERTLGKIQSQLDKFIKSDKGVSDYYNSKNIFSRKSWEHPLDLTLNSYKKGPRYLKGHYKPKKKKRDNDIDSLIVRTEKNDSSRNKSSFSSFNQSSGSSKNIRSVCAKRFKNKYNSYNSSHCVEDKKNIRISSERCFEKVKPSAMDIGLSGSKHELSLLLGTNRHAVNFKKRNYSGPVTLNLVLNQSPKPPNLKKKRKKRRNLRKKKGTKC